MFHFVDILKANNRKENIIILRMLCIVEKKSLVITSTLCQAELMMYRIQVKLVSGNELIIMNYRMSHDKKIFKY